MENQREFVYNQNQRLIRAMEGTNVLGEYVYNVKGQRVKNTVGEQTTLYHYDLQGNLIAESTAVGTITTEYVYMNGHLIGKIEGDSLSYYHADHLSTPMIMTDTNGAKVWEGEFMPFGEPMSISGTETNNLRFPGQYYDQETRLHQNWHREYKAEMGRYIEKDPIGIQEGTNHLYSYVRNNPIETADLTGLSPFVHLPPSGCQYYMDRCKKITNVEKKTNTLVMHINVVEILGLVGEVRSKSV